MDSSGVCRLRRVKPFYFGVAMASSPVQINSKVKHLLKIDFKSPYEDYLFVQALQRGQGTIVCHRKGHLKLALIRESYAPEPLQMLEMLSQVKHHNIADVNHVFFHDERLWIVGEHVGLSLLDLGFHRVLPEEWEIATIMAEVLLRQIAYGIE